MHIDLYGCSFLKYVFFIVKQWIIDEDSYCLWEKLLHFDLNIITEITRDLPIAVIPTYCGETYLLQWDLRIAVRPTYRSETYLLWWDLPIAVYMMRNLRTQNNMDVRWFLKFSKARSQKSLSNNPWSFKNTRFYKYKPTVLGGAKRNIQHEDSVLF